MTTIPILLQSAKDGNVNAMRNLASHYRHKDKSDQMIKWYTLAALNNDTKAMYCLGYEHMTGEHVERNILEAIRWFEMGAKAGHCDCLCQLGYIYYIGNGVKQNKNKAAKYYEQAAKLGSDNAIKNLTVILADKKQGIPMQVLGNFLSTFLIMALLLVSCKENKDPVTVYKPPFDPGASIHEGSIATTQISGKLEGVKNTFESHSKQLQTTASTIQDNANGAKSNIPADIWPKYQKWWDNVVALVPNILVMKENSDKSAQLVSDLRDRTADVVRQLTDAQKANDAQKADFIKQIQDRDDAIKQKDAIIVEKENKIHDVLRNKLVWIIVGAIPMVGIFVVLGVLVNPAIGKAGAIGSGIVIAIATFLGETLWMWPYIFGACAAIGIGLLLYLAIKHRNALMQLVQSGEIMNQALPPEEKSFIFGNGAIRGLLHDEQSSSTQKYVKYFKKYVRKSENAITPLRVQK